MTQMGEIWKAQKEETKLHRALMRESGKQALREANIIFSEHNGGAHLIVEGPKGFIDFWPGTNKWMCRAERVMRFGQKKLVKFVLGGRLNA